MRNVHLVDKVLQVTYCGVSYQSAMDLGWLMSEGYVYDVDLKDDRKITCRECRKAMNEGDWLENLLRVDDALPNPMEQVAAMYREIMAANKYEDSRDRREKVWDNDEIDPKDISRHQHTEYRKSQRYEDKIYRLRQELRAAQMEIADLKKAPHGYVRSNEDPRVLLDQIQMLNQENSMLKQQDYSLKNRIVSLENNFKRELQRIERERAWRDQDLLYSSWIIAEAVVYGVQYFALWAASSAGTGQINRFSMMEY